MGLQCRRIPGRLSATPRLSGRRPSRLAHRPLPAEARPPPRNLTKQLSLLRPGSAGRRMASRELLLRSTSTNGHRVPPRDGQIPNRAASSPTTKPTPVVVTPAPKDEYTSAVVTLRLLHAAEHDPRAAGRPAHAAAEPLLAPAAELCATRGRPLTERE